MVRRTSTVNFDRRASRKDHAGYGDPLDQMSLIDILREHKPDEIYNWQLRACAHL
jgi:GDPmannose 4,6-dehydratase